MARVTPAKTNNFFETFDDNPFHQYLGLTLVRAEVDFVQLRLQKTSTTPWGIGGSVNGGVLATMIDMAGVAAVFTQEPRGSEPAGTADLSVTYLRQAQGRWLDAEARVVKRGRQLCTIDVRILNDEQTLCVIGRVLYALKAKD